MKPGSTGRVRMPFPTREVSARLWNKSSIQDTVPAIAARNYISSHRRTTTTSFLRSSTVPNRQCAGKGVLLSHTRNLSLFKKFQSPAPVQHVQFTTPPRLRWYQQPWGRRVIAFILLFNLSSMLRESYRKRQDSEEVTVDNIKQAIKAVKSIPEEGNPGANAEPTSQDNEEEDNVIEIDEDDAWFITCTWPKQKPDQDYKSTDEEWVQFHKFSQDKARKDSVNRQAVQLIEIVVKGNPALLNVLGDPTRPAMYWLDVDYPTSYCDGYEASGILITDDFLAWATRDFDDKLVQTFFKVMSPIPLLQAVWNTTKQLYKDRDNFTTKLQEQEKMPFGMPAVPGIPDLSATPGLAKVVKASLHKLRKPIALTSIPKGCVMVSGRIDVTGSRAWATFGIVGFYHPGQDGWYDVPRISLGAIRPLRLIAKG